MVQYSNRRRALYLSIKVAAKKNVIQLPIASELLKPEISKGIKMKFIIGDRKLNNNMKEQQRAPISESRTSCLNSAR